jgi:ATP-binding cassette subfamily B protein
MASEERRALQNTILKPTLKEKFAALHNLPRFFKLVWDTNHWYTIINALLRIIKSAIPVAVLYVGKLIIDEVVMLSKSTSVTDHTYLWELVAAEFALAIASDALSRAILLIDSLLGDLFSNHTSSTPPLLILTSSKILLSMTNWNVPGSKPLVAPSYYRRC